MAFDVYDFTTDQRISELFTNITLESCADQRSFFDMLTEYIPKTGYKAPPNPRILNLGCGECYEAIVLTNFFNNGTLVGIDKNNFVVKEARKGCRVYKGGLLKQKWENSKDHKFICGDARNLAKLVDGEFDVVVSRNPDICLRPSSWLTVYKETRKLMKHDSLFIGTVLTDLEQDELEKMLETAGYQIDLSCPNKHTTLSFGEASRDKNIIFARKG